MNKPDYFDKKKWLIDELSEDLVQIHGIQRVLHAKTTRFQQAQIVRNPHFRYLPGAGRKDPVRRQG